jgi:OmpA-OmpF porin, OOP family
MRKILPLLLLSFITMQVIAQETFELKDSTALCKKSYDKQFDYENNLSAFPPKKKSNWTVGVDFGSSMILGDARPYFLDNMGASFKLEKSFTHLFSLRLQSLFAEMHGYSYFEHNGLYHNYKARMTDNSLQAVFHLNNVSFYNKQPKVSFKFFGGLGFASSFLQTNLLDADGNLYDYSGIADVETFTDRRFVVNQIRNLLDDGYETVIKPAAGTAAIGDTRILPSLVFGTGMDFHLTKRLDLALEARVSKHFTDNLDGFQYGNNQDWLIYMSAGLNFKIGKNTEPLYWQNPISTSYESIMELKAAQDPSSWFEDTDGDGVPDIIDQDPYTPKGVAVDPRGIPLDSDGDGVPDYLDKQPFSPKGALVDNFGVAVDTDGDGVPDIHDLEPNTPKGALVDIHGREITGGGTGRILSVKGVDVWTIFFDTDDFKVKSEYNAILLNLASFMIEYPEARILVTGYTDNRFTEEYNLQLSKKRASTVLEKFKNLGIDSKRFEMEYKGKSDFLIDATKEDSDLRHQLNRRVTLRVID